MVVVAPGENEVDLPRGKYRIKPRVATVEGTRYIGAASPGQVQIQNRDVSKTITYSESLGIQNLGIVALSPTSVELAWDAVVGQGVVVRRVVGTDPALIPQEGT
ncbi:MAG: hypothetical protein GXX79_22025, partial [Actinomycetales bacterium]|nr:hypothetical protein [Actinomycetales bacterium]